MEPAAHRVGFHANSNEIIGTEQTESFFRGDHEAD
jgi:hypothetical protein